MMPDGMNFAAKMRCDELDSIFVFLQLAVSFTHDLKQKKGKIIVPGMVTL